MGRNIIPAYDWRAWNLNWSIMIQQLGNTTLSLIQHEFTRKPLKSDSFSYWRLHQIFMTRNLSFLTLWNIWRLQASNMAPTLGNSFVIRRVSQGIIIALLFWTKYEVPHQNKRVWDVYVYIRYLPENATLPSYIRFDKLWQDKLPLRDDAIFDPYDAKWRHLTHHLESVILDFT